MTDTRGLVGLRMHILRLRSGDIPLLDRARQLTLEQLQTCLDVRVRRIKIRGSAIRIKRVGDLVVARFVQSS